MRISLGLAYKSSGGICDGSIGAQFQFPGVFNTGRINRKDFWHFMTSLCVMKFSNDSSLIFSNGCSVTCVFDDFDLIEDGVCSDDTEDAILDKEKCLYEVFRQPGMK